MKQEAGRLGELAPKETYCRMTDEQQQPGSHRETPSAPPIPSDGEIFGTPFAQQPTRDDLFSSLAEFASEPSTRPGGQPQSGLRGLPSALARIPGLSHLSRIEKILAGGIVTIAMAVLYVLLVRTTPPLPADQTAAARLPAQEEAPPRQAEIRGQKTTEDKVQRTEDRQQKTASASVLRQLSSEARSPTAETEESPAPSRALPGPEPLSLRLADKLYLRREFEPAFAMYDKLYRRLPATEENQPLRDFLLLRMALCSKNSSSAAQADTMFRTVSLSRLPILRALARYHQSTTLLSRKRYLEAAAKAYQTAALIEVASYDKKWVSAVQQQCGFLAAEAVTHNLLSLCDADANLPRDLWTEHPDIDPFVDLEEPQLRVFLSSGVEQLDGTVLSPQIRSTGEKSSVPRWSVICNGAPIEELLARFAANAGVNIHWSDGGSQATTEDNIRARPVHLFLLSATTLQAITMAAGSVGLIAQSDDKGVIRLLDPTSYSSLADHTKLLADEALTLWQRFLLTAENDPRAANAHFATALLQATRGQFDEAVAEYRLVANRFAKHALAPHALLQSGMLKVRLRDYVGAHADLKQLVELYPETELSDRAGLYLADATMKAGLHEEAVGLYRKVYNLGLSLESQAQSALGAGRCLYETKEYEEAAKWLSRYVTLARDQSRPGFSAACLLLGKTCLALHQPKQAQAALNLALRGELSHQQHVETVGVLVKTCLEQGLFLEALNTLEGTGGWQLSQQEAVDLMLLRAQALRSIGLADKAMALLEEKSQYLPSPELQAKVALEIARCATEGGNFEAARRTLGQAFAAAGPGPLADQIGRELAEMCLRLGQTAQAVSVCSQLLERAPASEREPILALLADAYRKQGKYSQAVSTMLDRYDVPPLIKDH